MFWFIYSTIWALLVAYGLCSIANFNPLSLLPQSKRKEAELKAAEEKEAAENKLLADPDYQAALVEVECDLGYPTLEEVLRRNATIAKRNYFDRRTKKANAIVTKTVEKAIECSRYGHWELTHTLFEGTTENHGWGETPVYKDWMDLAKAAEHLLKERYPELTVEICHSSRKGVCNNRLRMEKVELYVAWALWGQKEPSTLDVITGAHKWLDEPGALEEAKLLDKERKRFYEVEGV